MVLEPERLYDDTFDAFLYQAFFPVKEMDNLLKEKDSIYADPRISVTGQSQLIISASQCIPCGL